MNIKSSFSKRVKMRLKPFELAEEPFDFVAALVEFFVIVPRLFAIVLGRHDGGEAGLDDGCAGFIAPRNLIHGHGQLFRQGFGLVLLAFQKGASIDAVTGLPGVRLNVTAVLSSAATI